MSASPTLERRLDQFARGAWRRAIGTSAAILATTAGCGAVLLMAADRWLLLEVATRRLLVLAGALAALAWIRREGWARGRPRSASFWAEVVERTDPSWGGDLRLAAAVPAGGPYDDLRDRAAGTLGNAPPADALARFPLVAAMACATATWIGIGAGTAASDAMRTGWVRLLPWTDAHWTRIVSLDAPQAVGRGDAVTIEVHAEGLLPEQAVLRVHAGPTFDPSALRAPESHGRYRFRIGQLLDPLEFSVVVGDSRSERRTIRVLDRPHLLSLDARIEPPPYTGQPPREGPVEGPMQMLAGSTLRLSARFNKRIAQVSWEGTEPGDRVSLVEAPDGTWTWEGAVTESRRGTVQVRDVDGLAPDRPVPLHVETIPDRAPSISIERPRTTERMVVPGGTVPIRATARDDFGLAAVDLVTARPGTEEPVVSRIASAPSVGNPWSGDATWTPPGDAPAPGQEMYVLLRATDLSPMANAGESERLRIRIVAPDAFARHLDERVLATRHRLEGIADRVVTLRAAPSPPTPAQMESVASPLGRAIDDLAEILEEIEANRVEAMFPVEHLRGTHADLAQGAAPPLAAARAGGAGAPRPGDALETADRHIHEALRRLASWEDLVGVQRHLREILSDQEAILRLLGGDPPGGAR